jgi:hypothetical protein
LASTQSIVALHERLLLALLGSSLNVRFGQEHQTF